MPKKRGRQAGYGATDMMTIRFTHCRALQQEVIDLAVSRGVSVNQLVVDVLRAHFVAIRRKKESPRIFPPSA